MLPARSRQSPTTSATGDPEQPAAARRRHAKVATAATAAGALMAVDSTFAAPLLQNPLVRGAQRDQAHRRPLRLGPRRFGERCKEQKLTPRVRDPRSQPFARL